MLVERATSLRWRAPELALVLGERAVGALDGGSGSARSLRLRAESLVVSAMVRLGRRAAVVHRALTALRTAEEAGAREVAWQLRVDLAVCARSAGAPRAGLAALRPVLEVDGVPSVLRAQALTQLVGCLAHRGRTADLDRALDEADGLCASEYTLDEDTRVMLRALVYAGGSAYRRRCGDTAGARQAALAGFDVLANMTDPLADGEQARARLTLELASALLDDGESDEALKVAQPVLTAPLRTPAAGAAGWLWLAIATRVHLPDGRYEQALGMLRDTVYHAERYGLAGLTAQLWTELAYVERVVNSDAAALECLYQARAAGYWYDRARRAAATSLVERFGTADAESVRVDGLLSRETGPAWGSASGGEAAPSWETASGRDSASSWESSSRQDTAPSWASSSGRDSAAAWETGAGSDAGSGWNTSDARDTAAGKRHAEAAELDRTISELTRKVTERANGRTDAANAASGRETEADRESAESGRNDIEVSPRRRAQWSPSVVRGMGSSSSGGRRRGRRRVEEREPSHRAPSDEVQLSAVSATERWRRSRNIRDENTDAEHEQRSGSAEDTGSSSSYAFPGTAARESWTPADAMDNPPVDNPPGDDSPRDNPAGEQDAGRGNRSAEQDSDTGRGILSQLSFTSGSGGRRRAPGGDTAGESSRPSWAESQENSGGGRAEMSSAIEEILARIERTSAEYRAQHSSGQSDAQEQRDASHDASHSDNGQVSGYGESLVDWSDLDPPTHPQGTGNQDDLLPMLHVPSVLAAPGESAAWATGPEAEPPESTDTSRGSSGDWPSEPGGGSLGEWPGSTDDVLSRDWPGDSGDRSLGEWRGDQDGGSFGGWPGEQSAGSTREWPGEPQGAPLEDWPSESSDTRSDAHFFSSAVSQDEAWPSPSQAPRDHGKSGETGMGGTSGAGTHRANPFDSRNFDVRDTAGGHTERRGGRHASPRRNGATPGGVSGDSTASEETTDGHAGRADGTGRVASSRIGTRASRVSRRAAELSSRTSEHTDRGASAGYGDTAAGEPRSTETASGDTASGDTGSGNDGDVEDRADLGLADLLAGALAAYRTTEDGGSRQDTGSGDEPERRDRGRHRSID